MALYVLNGYELSNRPWWNVSKGTIKAIFRSLLSFLVDGFSLMITAADQTLQRRLWQDLFRSQLSLGIAF